MKSSNIGGQAVMEGIMMRSGDQYSVGVRKPDGEIEVKVEPYNSWSKDRKLWKLPIFRGVVSFFESLVVGMKCLMYSASFYEDEEEEQKNKDKMTQEESARAEARKEKQDQWIMYGTVAVSVVLSIALFILLPYFIASVLRWITQSEGVIAIAEACVRMLIFLGYLLLISQMKDIQRVFMYHGAEHKCINCIEHGLELNVENVMKSSRKHKRCGTSFLLFVMIVSIIFFLFIRVSSPWLRIVVRLLLMPVIAGVSYEIIRLAGRSEHPVIVLLSKPGLALQKLTTREPEPEMVEVAIQAVEAVFDWKEYLKENFPDGEEQ
ncbi:MAG: DUF1385 domain-containing protein [Oliverpabstia sp.]|nr:DUF1385 domain-containing protein [Lachnospiraceae bacterium]MDY5026047.1 DUF1385 domain-containing protein [Oliverpabstia sp.]